MTASVAAVASAYPFWRIWSGSGDWWVLASIATGVAAGIVSRQVLRILGRRQTLSVLPAFEQARVDGQSALQQALDTAKAETRRKEDELKRRRDEQINAAQLDWARQRNDIMMEHEARIRDATEQFRQRRQAIE